MTKVDKTRNYYGDLELSSNATLDDIKKQYRKLVLLWHPDRNRGNEKQAAIRFQNIQSAYEILADENTKREYDVARGSLRSRYPMASGVRGNPYQDIGKQYPRPPTRYPTQAKPQSRPSGAQRYASEFGGNVPRSSTRANRDEADNIYSAWQNMRPNHSNRGKANPPPTPGRAPTSAARDSSNRQEPPKRPEPSAPPPRTASQRQKAQAAFGTRKSGYEPYSPGLGGDEPPVTSKNYYTTRVHTNIFGQTSTESQNEEPPAQSQSQSQSQSQPQPQPQHQSSSTIPDPLARFRDIRLDGRQSAPYHSSTREKTSLYDEGPGLGRTTSTRTPPRKTEMPGSFPRPRSSSTPKAPPDDRESDTASTKADVGSKNGFSHPAFTHFDAGSARNYNGYAGFDPQAGSSHKHKPKSQNMANPSPLGGHPATSSGPNQSTANPQPVQNNGHPSAYETPLRPSHTTPKQPTLSSGGQADLPRNRVSNFDWPLPDSHQYVRDPSSEGSPYPSPSLMPFEAFQKVQVEDLLSRRKTQHGRNEKCVAEAKQKQRPVTPVPATDSSATVTNFSRPFSSKSRAEESAQYPSASTSRLARNSTENINTNFVQGDRSGDWLFTAGSPVNNEPSASPMQSSPSAARSIRRPTTRIRPVTTNSVPTQQSMPKDTGTQPFSAGEWSEKIGSEHFVPPPSTSSSSSPTRRPNSKKTKPSNNKATSSTAATVDSDENDSCQEIPRSQYNAPPVNTDSPNAMDIDSPPHVASDNTPKEAQAHQTSQSNGARNIHVEPTRPDWRAGNVDPVAPKTGSSMPGTNHNIPAETPGATTWTTTSAHVNHFAPHNGGSEDIDDLRVNFDDFKKTEPFKDPAPTGLGSFTDMKTTLPFESRPAERLPTDMSTPFAPLGFPIPPVAPRLPNAATRSARPSASDYRKYTEDFTTYMEKWEIFFAKVTTHLTARQSNSSRRRQEHGPGWLNARDRLTHEEYMAEVNMDQDILRKFADAHMAHLARVREFGELKERMK